MVTVVPFPTIESKRSRPPCSSMIPAEIYSPRPVPPLSRLVVKKGSLMCLR